MMLPLRLLGAFVIAATLAGCGEREAVETPAAAPALTAQDVADNNRGVGLMGSFDYHGARDVFAQVVERQPGWHDARINLAIATLNLQTEEDEQRALALAAEVLAAEPDHARAHYVSGLLKLYRSRTDEAAAHFRAVLEADPDDAYAAYYLAQCVAPADGEAALALYERALQADPYLRSAYYGAALVARRLGRTEEAKEGLAVYTRLADNPRARLAEFKYTRMGDKGNAKVADLPGAAPAPAPQGPLLLEPQTIAPLPGPARALSVVDLDGDGLLDLFVAGGDDAPSALYMAAEDELQAVERHPLAGIRGVTGAAWGDVDNDGLVDAYLCRDGGNALWRQSAPGTWRDVTAASGTGNGRARCADAAMLDADHDGDLDLFVANADAPAELYSNNLDGTFRTLGGRDGFDLPSGARQVLANDFDNDRDLDLMVLAAQAPHALFVNDRLWSYRRAEGVGELLGRDLRAAVATDADGDGRIDLVTAEAGGDLTAWHQGADGTFAPTPLGAVAADARLTLTAVELNGYGQSELLVRDDAGVRVLSLDGRGAEAPGAVLYEAAGDFDAVVPVVGDPRAGPGVLAVRRADAAAELVRFAPGPGRGGFAAFALTGKEEIADSMRSNRSGLGTRVALRTGSQWSLGDTLDAHSGPGQSLQPLTLATGEALRADYVALTWSDGVFQTELDVAAGALHEIAETQRQLSSCPVVFAFDGERFRFVSDVLGVGGVGFLIEPGRYATPRPWEYFLLPDGALAPRDGELAIKISEPMEEIAYLDQARVHVYDLAPPWSVVLDERMGTGAPAPTGEALFYRHAVQPARAWAADGTALDEALRARDGRAAPPGPLDRRFIGRTAAPHSVTLEFDRPLDAHRGRPVLVAEGWVEYPYSQTVFAAWQAGAEYTPPTLEARDGAGVWHTVHAHFGYPAGMPRQMALPLDALPAGANALRLRSTLQIYWDRFEVVFAEDPGAAVVRREASLARADVRAGGFAQRRDGPQRRPHYDYDARVPLWDSRHLAGWYTAFGPAHELIAERDDAFAIIGPGEELDLRFTAPPAPQQGIDRRYVLEVRGYAKDMDLYTRDGGKVAPLPDTADVPADLREAARARLHGRYNTRYEAGY